MDIRFHLDENAHGEIADGLRRRGIDVTTAADAGLLNATDDAHLAFARSRARVVFTHDPDFLRLHAAGMPHAGIAFCHVQKYTLGGLVNALTALWRRRTAEEMHNHVEFL